MRYVKRKEDEEKFTVSDTKRGTDKHRFLTLLSEYCKTSEKFRYLAWKFALHYSSSEITHFIAT